MTYESISDPEMRKANSMATNQVTGTNAARTEPAAMKTERDAGKVLMLGGLAAGAVAGVLVLLMEKDDEPKSRTEQARKALEEVTETARKRGDKVEGELASTLAAFRGDAKKQGKKARKDARKSGKKLLKDADKRASKAATGLNDILSQARNEIRHTYEVAGKKAPDVETVLDEVRARAEELITEARESGRTLQKQTRKDAGKAKKDMASLLDVVKSRASDAEKVAESYVESTLLPKLKEFEKEAASAFESGKKRSKERGEEFRKHAESELLPQARESAEKLRATVEDQAKHLSENWEKGSHDAVEVLHDARETVESQAKDAGDAVKRGGRETRSLLVWLGLAAALIYWVFLDEEQQKKVQDLSMDLFGEAREMYSDLKGDNDSL